MHDEHDARERRQPSFAAARQCVLVKPKHRLHDASPLASQYAPSLSLNGDRMSTASISRRLSGWAVGLAYADIPPEVLDRARGVTLQGLSSCLLGHDFPETKQAVRLVEEEERGCGGTTTALVDGRRFSRAGAAFINSETIFAWGKWDTFRMVVHANCAIVPAALMAAEATRCSGREFLTGVVAGYEVTDRLAADFVPTILARGFHPGPVFSIFGAAVALAKIMGLD